METLEGNRFEDFPGSDWQDRFRESLAAIACPDPYFLVHESSQGSLTKIGGRELVNFSSYDYLGLNKHPRVLKAAKLAIDKYGVSPGASRLVAGERGIHRELEDALARHFSHEACLSFVSGYGANVSVISTLIGPGDVIFCDSLAHNSILMGAKLSGAKIRLFPHNNLDELDSKLARVRGHFQRAMIVAEGLYSMDGDICDLARLIDLKRRHGAALLIDDAHGMGVLGKNGRGIFEETGVNPRDIDVWIGTLSKTLSSTGGYVVGSKAMINYLKLNAGGFVFSVALAPVMAAAALEAYEIMSESPERVRALRDNSRAFASLARGRGLDTGQSMGFGIVPIIVGDTVRALLLSAALGRRGVNVQPMIYPAVANGQARLRFFVTADHSSEQLRTAAAITAEELDALASGAECAQQLS